MTSFRVTHRTVYQFDTPIERCTVRALLRPRGTARQRVSHAGVVVMPLARRHASSVDHFGNLIDSFELDEKLRRLEVVGHSVVELGTAGGGAEPDAAPFAEPSAADAPARDATIWAWAAQHLPDLAPTPIQTAALMAQLRRDFVYDPSVSVVGEPLDRLFARCRGACQDFARLAIACLRVRGIPCRYVIGYVDPQDRPHRAERTLAHAWLAAWFPDSAWVEFDPTNGIDPAGRHIVLGWGRDQADVQPVAGDLGGAAPRQRLAVDIEVATL